MALGLLDIMQDALGVAVTDDAPEICGGVVIDLGAQDDGFGVLLGVELEHLVQRKRAADVGVENEQAFGFALEDCIAEVVQAAGGTKSLVLAQVLDREVGKCGRGVLEEIAKDRLVIVANKVDLGDGGNLRNGGQAVIDDGVASDVEERL